MWSANKPSASQIIVAIALVALGFYLAIALIEYMQSALAALTFPFPLDYGEGPVLEQTVRLAHLENIYSNDLSTPPYTVSNYPPLYQLIQIPFVLLFGPAFMYGRLISILSAIAAAVLIGSILYILTFDPLASAIGGLLLLAFPFVVQWSVFDRVDTFGLVLSLLGLYIVLRSPTQWLNLLLAALLFTAAIFTKPSFALTAPFAAFVWLWLTKMRKQAFALVALIAGGSLSIFILLNGLTQGGFYLNTIVANWNAFSAQRIMQNVIDLYVHAGFLIIAGILFIFVERLTKPARSWHLTTPYFFGAALGVLASGKAGSSGNYLYEFATALCLVTGALLAWIGNNYWLKAIVVLLLALQMNLLLDWSSQQYIPPVRDKFANYQEVIRLAAIVRSSPNPVLADEYMGLLPLYGRRIYLQPFEFKQLQEANLWDQKSLIAEVQQKKFSAILLYEPSTWNAIVERWTPEVREAIYDNYRLDQTLADTFVYVPR